MVLALSGQYCTWRLLKWWVLHIRVTGGQSKYVQVMLVKFSEWAISKYVSYWIDILFVNVVWKRNIWTVRQSATLWSNCVHSVLLNFINFFPPKYCIHGIFCHETNKWFTDTEGLICQALLLGNTEAAVELCLLNGRMADAIILTMTGGSDLLAKTQYRYFQVTWYILHGKFLLFASSSLRYKVKAGV